jgi:hypothetical protein
MTAGLATTWDISGHFRSTRTIGGQRFFLRLVTGRKLCWNCHCGTMPEIETVYPNVGHGAHGDAVTSTSMATRLRGLMAVVLLISPSDLMYFLDYHIV